MISKLEKQIKILDTIEKNYFNKIKFKNQNDLLKEPNNQTFLERKIYLDEIINHIILQKEIIKNSIEKNDDNFQNFVYSNVKTMIKELEKIQKNN